MGLWRNFKGWIKRTMLQMVMRFVRTKFYRYLRKIARASVVPLSITAGAAGVGMGVASTVAFPLVYGALIGASAGVLAVVSVKCWMKHGEEERSRRKKLTTFSIVGKKGKDQASSSSSSRGTFVLATSSGSSKGRTRR